MLHQNAKPALNWTSWTAAFKVHNVTILRVLDSAWDKRSHFLHRWNSWCECLLKCDSDKAAADPHHCDRSAQAHTAQAIHFPLKQEMGGGGVKESKTAICPCVSQQRSDGGARARKWRSEKDNPDYRSLPLALITVHECMQAGISMHRLRTCVRLFYLRAIFHRDKPFRGKKKQDAILISTVATYVARLSVRCCCGKSSDNVFGSFKDALSFLDLDPSAIMVWFN